MTVRSFLYYRGAFRVPRYTGEFYCGGQSDLSTAATNYENDHEEINT